MDEVNVCPQCKISYDNGSNRLVQDSCGHKKCRLCLLNDENECKLCVKENVVINRQNVINHTADVTINEKNTNDNTEKINKVKNTSVIPKHITVVDNTFSCNICKKNFTSKSSIKYHYYCAGDKKPYHCQICRKSCISKSHFDTHMLTHQNVKPFQCEKCDKRFYERSKLNRHKLIHDKLKGFVCSDCGRTFKNKDNLRTHSYIHRTEKPYSCHRCELKFNHSSNLKKHLVSHNENKEHMCEQCGKRFKLKWALSVHKKSHLKIKPNKCIICSKAFLHLSDLQRHKITHADNKLFACGICGTKFKRKDNLNRHFKNSHPGKKNVIIRSSESTKSVVIDNPNAIKVITSPNSFKQESTPKKLCSTVINPPVKLALKTTEFKNNYNLHRDYVEPTVSDPEMVNIYERILLPSSSTGKIKVHREAEEIPIKENILEPLAALHYETSFINNKDAIIKNIKFKVPYRYIKLKNDEKSLKTDIVSASCLQPDIVEDNLVLNDTACTLNNNLVSNSDTDGTIHSTPCNLYKSDDLEIINNVKSQSNELKRTYIELQPVAVAQTSVIVNPMNYLDIHWRRRPYNFKEEM